MVSLSLPSEKKKKGSAFRNKPRTKQLGEDFVIQHVRGLVERGTTFAAAVKAEVRILI